MTRDLTADVLGALASGPATAYQIGVQLNWTARSVASICVRLEREGVISRLGIVKARDHNRVPLWCLAGREGEDGVCVPVVQRKPLPAPVAWPDTLTGMLLGDPSPGRSALFRKLNGVQS